MTNEHTEYYSNLISRQKAKTALAEAKKLEAEKMKKGARYHKVDGRTWVLKKL